MTYPIRDVEDSKVFTAKSGIDYKIILLRSDGYFPVPPQIADQIISVSLLHQAEEAGEHDEAIMNTLLDYLFSILMDNPNVIFTWICADGDGLELRRHRYFNFLFIRAKRTGLYGLRTEVIGSDIQKKDTIFEDEGKVQYLSMVLREANPCYNEVIDIFNVLKELIAQKAQA